MMKKIKKNAKSPTNNKQLEHFVGLVNFYGRMIPDFATKLLPLNNMRNSDFSWGKLQQKAFEDTKNCLAQPYSFEKQQLLATTLKKPLAGTISQEGHPAIFV